MPVYHSQFNETASEDVCGCALLPLGHSSARGPAQIVHVGDNDPGDIVDEAISLFRANVLFRNFEIQGPADRVLIYLTLFIHQCLKRVEKKKSRAEAEKDLYSLASSPHVLPGDSTWPLTTLIDMPRNEREKEILRNYLRQLRETTVMRLLDRIYYSDGTPNPHWIMFSKRKFMNKEFV